MIRALTLRPRDSWSEAVADSVVLDFDDRHRRRITMTGVGGLSFLLDLADAVMLRSGDALVLEDGRLVEVLSAPEPLVEIRAGEPVSLARLAWHIGNRHVPAQILPKAIRICRDHVIEDMVRSLGAAVREIEAPFDPEGGAYAAAPVEHKSHEHGHDAGHGHHAHGNHDHVGHDHAGHDHAHHGHKSHDHDHGHKHDHGHGPHDH